MLQDHDLYDVDAYFEAEYGGVERFWARIGRKPDFAGARVLDVGSGHGALSIRAAQDGAAEVLGVDILEPRLHWARGNMARRFPQLAAVRFELTSPEGLDGEGRFDLVVSKDTFEHVADIATVLAACHRLLRPGGAAHLGFSPLYHSPFGDHGVLRAPVRLPWLHLLAGRRRVIAACNAANRSSFATLPDAGFNGLRPRDFLDAFRQAGFALESVRVNRTEGRLKQAAMNLCAALARLPPLTPYLTIGMYVVLRRPE